MKALCQFVALFRLHRARALLVIATLAVVPLALWAFWVPRPSRADSTLVPAGAVWKYLDNGSDQDTAWRGIGFNDSTWAAGAAQMGYGDGDETTVVAFGPDAANKRITTYFRRLFTVADASGFGALTLRLLRDDGAVVYLNGIEVFRSNMPAGTVGHTTPASSALGGSDETIFVEANVGPNLLISGTNLLAVELHQANGGSSDISFDLQLIGSDLAPAPALTRGPYLQIGTPSSVVVRWRTGAPADSSVHYGLGIGNLNSHSDDAGLTIEHSVVLSGLTPDTTYHYSVGTTAAVLAGDDDRHFFVTSPPDGSPDPARIWVLGDSGTANASAAAVRDAYYSFSGQTHTNIWLMLGDNAYNTGTDAEYQAAVFNMYPEVLRQSVLWPTIGNHDTAGSTSPPATLPYYQIFTLPIGAEAGGLASGTEDYYSFDYGNVHFICLDSMTSDRSANGPMMTWLRSDIVTTARTWIIAFWHHPPYTKGSHDSDTETQLVEMRQNALPILEEGGVDLVLTGHSHSYERSFLIDGHYGVSSSFANSMKKDGGDGRTDGTGAYLKAAAEPFPHQGAVYAVAGSSGQISGGMLNHPAMFISLSQLGSMVLDVDGNRLDAKFLISDGTIGDHFTLLKGSPPLAPAGLTATAITSSRIDLNWSDNSTNETGFKVERSVDGTNFTEIATLGANNVSYSNTGLSPSSTFHYRVRAFNAAGASSYSIVSSAMTPAGPPAAPSGLRATAVSKGQINLAWTDNASNENGFKIDRSKDGISFTQIVKLGANIGTYSDTGLRSNRTFYYRVRVFNAVGNSDFSNVASARTLSALASSSRR